MAILAVEDDADLLDILSFTLRRDGHDVIPARDGEAALALWSARDPQLILLDVNIPKVNGWQVCERIRAEADTPVVMLTGMVTTHDIARGFELGVDDYVTKPYSPRELSARIRAILSRTDRLGEEPRRGWQVTTAGDLTLDPQWRSVTRGNRQIKLTATEFKLLYELVLHEGQVLPHKILTDRVWGFEGVDDSSLLKGHIRNLRRKIEPNDSEPVYVQTVGGIGYTFRQQKSAA
jgi:two-component system alkaline phosphatase synthesis response regulator PhoP